MRKNLYVPRVEDRNRNMQMLNISSIDDLIANSMNILEPAPVDAEGNERKMGPDPRAAIELIRIDGVLDAIIRHLKKAYCGVLVILWPVMLIRLMLFLLLDMESRASLLLSLSLAKRRKLLFSPVPGLLNADILIFISDNVIVALTKCLKSEHRVLKKEAASVLSNIAAGSIEHKRLINSSEAIPLLLRLLSTAPFDIRKEVAYVLGNLCVAPSDGAGRPNLILDHLVSLVGKGCLPGFVDLVRSADTEAARLGLQFMELVLRGMPNGEGPKLVEREDGIDAMERFQFHENEDLRNMANELVDNYFGEDYGLEE